MSNRNLIKELIGQASIADNTSQLKHTEYPDILRRAAAALEAQEWQPISNAEHMYRDQTVLVLCENGFIHTMPAGSAFHMTNRGHRYFRTLDTLNLPTD